jgi:DNA-binding GntR family transcriptional regulator
VRAACERHTDEDVARLRENMVLAADAVKRQDFFARAEKHLEFHLILASATKNPIMDIIMESLIGVMRQFILTIGPHNIVDYALASRRRFMVHFEARDSEAAVKEMEVHLERVNRNYAKVLGERGASKK